MSLYIPNDVKDIIYKYKHNLEMKKICKEIEHNLYNCMNCENELMDNIVPIYLDCNKCYGKICIYCAANLHDEEIKTGNCLDCISKDCYISEIERILDKKLQCMEDDRFLTILDDHDLIEYEVLMLVKRLKDIEKNQFRYPQELHNEINIFCTSGWGYNNIPLDYDLQVDDYE